MRTGGTRRSRPSGAAHMCVPTAINFPHRELKCLKTHCLYLGTTRNLSFCKPKDFLGTLVIEHEKAAPKGGFLIL